MFLKSQTQMALNARVLVWSLLATFCVSYGTDQSDISCLKSIRESLEDPLNLSTSSWTFNNLTEGSICDYVGVFCWNTAENRVFSIQLANKGLKGELSVGIGNCRELVRLDLSGNELSGSIPSSIGNCSHLQVLLLDNNRLTGRIPKKLSQLRRLRIFSVANNLLSGPVPDFVNNIRITLDQSYVNNSKLCGGPLKHCETHGWIFKVCFKSGFVVGYVVFFLFYTAFVMFYFKLRVRRLRPTMTTTMTTLVKRRKNRRIEPGHRVTQCSTEEPLQQRSKELFISEGIIMKIGFTELSKATNNFSRNTVIGVGKRGTMHKAMLPDGTFLAVKRLYDPQQFEHRITYELITLAKLMHNNLVRLVGYCREMEEELLVYKYMSNGNLHDWLRAVEDKVKILEWPLRIKIAVGVARGLAWLHHGCDVLRIKLHLEICSKCILLDQNFEPKISKFGGAMFRNPNDIDSSSNFSSACEFGEVGLVKKDVYSFGIVLLELITGKKTSDRMANLANSPEGTLVQGNNHGSTSSSSGFYDVIHKSLIGKGYDGEIFQVLRIAFNCVQPYPDRRPTMFEVYETLRTVGARYGVAATDDHELLRHPESAAV